LRHRPELGPRNIYQPSGVQFCVIAFLRILLYIWLGGVFVIFCVARSLPRGQIDVAVFAGFAATLIAIALIGALVRQIVVLVRSHRRRGGVPRATASFRSDRAGR
jgi:hypothetical protein